eukprot:COSAG02_NODE_650_length_18912_cov_23.728698_8_plen_81_part_00
MVLVLQSSTIEHSVHSSDRPLSGGLSWLGALGGGLQGMDEVEDFEDMDDGPSSLCDPHTRTHTHAHQHSTQRQQRTCGAC